MKYINFETVLHVLLFLLIVILPNNILKVSLSALKCCNAMNCPGGVVLCLYMLTIPLTCVVYLWSVHSTFSPADKVGNLDPNMLVNVTLDISW